MGKYLICGAAGAGKTSVALELQKQGYTAYDVESYPGVLRLEDMSGNSVPWPEGFIDWSIYRSTWNKSIIDTLLASDDTVFLAGLASNQSDFYKSFDKIFVLSIDDTTLRQRLLMREKDYGKDPRQLEGEIAYRATRESNLLRETQAIKINANQSLNKVVDDILEYV